MLCNMTNLWFRRGVSRPVKNTLPASFTSFTPKVFFFWRFLLFISMRVSYWYAWSALYCCPTLSLCPTRLLPHHNSCTYGAPWGEFRAYRQRIWQEKETELIHTRESRAFYAFCELNILEYDRSWAKRSSPVLLFFSPKSLPFTFSKFRRAKTMIIIILIN